MTEHDLMEAGDPTQTSDLSSPPRRDSMEDADSTGTLTRKRPRLDSGSRATRSMSEDVSASDPQSPGNPTSEPVEVTINVRSQPPSSQPDSSSDLPTGISEAVTDMSSPDSPSLVVNNGDVAGEVDMAPISPPVVEINLDGETDDGYMEPQVIEDDLSVDEVFETFPFQMRLGGLSKALNVIGEHFQFQEITDPTLFPQITQWLKTYPALPSQYLDFYFLQPKFWDEIADVFRKLLLRRIPLGDEFVPPGESTTGVIFNILLAYVKICVRIFRVDVAILEALTEEEPANEHILSNKHLRVVSAMLRGDATILFRQIQKEFNQETHTMASLFVAEFVRNNFDCVKRLVNLAELSWAKSPPPAKNSAALGILQVLEAICRAACETPQVFDLNQLPKLCDLALRAFRTYDTDLQIPGKILDVQFNKDLVLQCASLLRAVAVLDVKIAKQLADEFMGFDGDSASSTSSSPVSEDMTSIPASANFDPDLLPALASNAWKFKLLKKYISKGRMELRVLCISTMDQQLVEIWKEYSPLGLDHPLMQYLADYLLHGKVVDYIIGVDSHPQLISRSGNIVGFLVVTHRYTDKETDAIWRTIANSPDPRVVSAIIVMLKHIVNLMRPEDLSAMCGKLYHMPIESYTLEVLRFAREITLPIMQKPRDWDAIELPPTPAQLFVRMIQDTAPSRTSTKFETDLFHEAADQLSGLSHRVGSQERFKIYRSCVNTIASKSSKATGSAHAVFLLCKDSIFEDLGILTNQLDIGRHLILELCDYVEKQRSEDSANVALGLRFRIQLIAHIGVMAAQSLPSDLHDQLWDHLFGKDAWNNDMRDHAWWAITETGKRRPHNQFCASIVSDLIPRLEPVYYTKGLFEFIHRLVPPLEKRMKASANGKEVLEVPGADLLRPLVLNAPSDQVVELSAKHLAARYLDIYRAAGVSMEEVEEAHASLAEECTSRLLSSYRILRSGSTASTEQGDPMAVVASDQELRAHERHFTRTLFFARLFLSMIRSKPEFARSRKADYASEPIEQELYLGDPLQVRFQAFGGPSNEKQSIVAGKEDTLRDLHDRLCRLTGFTKLRLIVGGQMLSTDNSGDKKLEDIPGIDWILVSKAAGAEPLKPETDSITNRSIFETTILSHFEDMYSCMDSDDHISEAMYDFLFLLKPREAIAESVAAGNAHSTDIFPPGRVFQAKYAGLALQSRLRAQLNQGIVDEKFLSNTIQLLDAALLNADLISASLAGKHDVPLASVLVSVLLSFLKERPLQDLSSNYFSNETLLIERLFSIIHKALDSGDENVVPVSDCYATVLEAFLHSKKVWEAFICRSDFESLHKTILLVDGRTKLREMIALSIASICGGDLPSSSPLTPDQIALVYWKTISAILPHSIQYPSQSAELFNIAEQVFRRNDEYNREEPELRAYLASWSNLLLKYKHEEFVGRDEVDIVVLGFTKLLLCCIQSLKSFKKPLDAGPLMEQTFRKFLFPPPADLSCKEHPNERITLPIMNSETRKELYDLMQALAEDTNSYETLLALAHSLLDENDYSPVKNYSIDRSTEIRSPTGYVGLVNPRAICYMNSLLTQLFMNVNFRQFMLEIKVSDDRGSQRLLSDTQKLFSQMQNTFRKAADPREFAACVKGLDSLPIDINVQMDADEFYNLLFDQWEGQMLSPALKQLFRSFYGGRTVGQIKSKECEHVSERVEPFFVIQCDVQGKANLQESLQSFVEGDVMEGDNKYKCESCGGKFVDAVKRTCLKDVPDNLIFHLKRFDFDLIDMRRTKINDHFEFPSEIDVSRYNVEHLSDPEKPTQEDMFDLVGVLVHQGNSENGHYYSFIRERPSPGHTQKWFDFNDRDVTDFEPSQIAYQAFGGIYDEHYQRQQKPFSAYMLFYQRKSAMDADHQKFISSPLSGPPKVPVPEMLEMEIAQDNESFVQEYCLYDPNHSRFIRQILSTLRRVNNGICSDDHEQETLALGIAIQHINQVISRMRDISIFDEIMVQLKKTIQGCAMCCNVAIHQICSNEQTLAGLLLRCPHMRIRAQIRTLLMDCLSHLRATDTTLYGADISDEDSETLVAEEDSALAIVTHQFGLLKYHLYLGTRGWDDYFNVFYQIARIGPLEGAAVLGNDMLAFSLRLFCMHAFPALKAENLTLWRYMEKRKGCFNQLIELIACLLACIDLDAELVDDHDERLSAFDKATQKFPLTREEHDLLFAWHDEHKAYATFDMMIEKFDVSKSEEFSPGRILKQALAVDDLNIRSRLYHTINEGINQVARPGNEPYVRAAIPFCEAATNQVDVIRIIRTVASDAASLSNQGGEAHADFFMHLPEIQNEHVAPCDRQPTFFYEQAITTSTKWGVGLLIYEDEAVRRNIANLLDHLLFRVHPARRDAREVKIIKFNSIRNLLAALCKRILHEYDQAMARSYIQTAFAMARTLAGVISEWRNTEEDFFSDADLVLLQHFSQVDQSWHNWPLEDDGILSPDAYEDSQYENSDSDEAIDTDR